MSSPSAWWLRNREVMPDFAAPHSEDIAARVSRHDMKWDAAEVFNADWAAGAPLGNGDLGALVYGPPDNLTFLLGKNDLWLRPTARSHFPSGIDYRGLLDIYRRQDRAAFEALLPRDASWPDSFLPSTLTQLATLRLSLSDPASYRAVRREVSLHDATCRLRFESHGLDNMWADSPDFEVMSFVSAPHDVLVIQLRRARLPLRSFTWRLGREAHRLLPPPRWGADGDTAWMEQDLPRGDRYALAIRQLNCPVTHTFGQRSLLGESLGDPQREAILIFAAATHRDSDDPLGMARQRVNRAAGDGLDHVHAEHRRYCSEHWRRSWVACSDVKLERPWYISNYLCGAILRPGKVSPGLQGMWCKENQPPWNADFHGNVNIQAVYQGILGSNHIDLLEPYTSLYAGVLEQCRRDAREFFKTLGSRFPHAGGIDGFEQTEPNWLPLAVSVAPTMWVARVYWWAWQHTGDREFLRDVAYPMLKDAALHVHGLLEHAGKSDDGRYRVEPSIWGEWACTSLDAWGSGSSYDIAASWAALQQAADAAEALGVDDQLRHDWRQAMSDLPEMPVDAGGVWLRWRHHPHAQKHNGPIDAGSFFHPVFPCELAGAHHGPERWRAQAIATWKQAREKTCSAWCGGSTTAGAARLGDADWAYRSATGALATNGLSHDLKSGIMQADHGPGMSLALNSMLMIDTDRGLMLFPALPSEIDVAFHSLRAPGALLVSAERRGGVVRHLAIQSLRGGRVRLVNPFGPDAASSTSVMVRHMDGQSIEGQHPAARFGDVMEWQASAGEVFEVIADSQ